jgi:cell division protein FtsI (penicillin-binding protein 3)
LAAVPGYRVAGKTGTAKKSVAGGYAEDKYLSLFVGMVPASNPRLVMAVMINEPGGEDYYGGKVAAPVFSKVMREALRILNIPPDADLSEQPRLAVSGAPR